VPSFREAFPILSGADVDRAVDFCDGDGHLIHVGAKP